jgi:DNA polymerase-3 subunit delta'
MNLNAANALLKVLEEPPQRALLLVVSHAPGRLLATIRSRCCRLALKPLRDEDVAGLLARARPELAPDDRVAIAALAEGSPGRALALADEDGLTLYRQIMVLLSGLPRPPAAALHAFGDQLARSGAEDKFRTATELMAWWLGRAARAGARGQGEPAAIVAEESGCAARLLAAAGVDRWLEVWEKIIRLSDQTDRLNLDRKQVLLTMFHALQGAMRS